MTATTPSPAGTPNPAGTAHQRVRTPGAFMAVYKLVLRNQLTIGRLFAVLALGALGLILGLGVGQHGGYYPIRNAARLVNWWTLIVVAPVISLVFASSAFGDLIDDRTMVYLWLKPVNRTLVAWAAALASFTVCLPAVLIPTVLMALLSGGGVDLVEGAAVASIVGVIAYVGLFLALGLRFRRALIWGLVYILLWEGFVANASKTATRLAVRGYTLSILSDYTGVGFKHADLSVWPAIIVPVAAGIAFVFLAAHRLARTEVD